MNWSAVCVHLQLGFEAIVQLLGWYQYQQTHHTGHQVTDVCLPQVGEEAVPGLEEGEPALRPRDFQTQQVLELGGEDGEGGSCSEATEEGVGEIDGDEAHLENAHEHLREQDEQD